MDISDFNSPIPRRSLRYGEGTMIGTVVKTSDEIGKSDSLVGVYIPKLMFGIGLDKGATEETVKVSTDKILNSKNKIIGKTSFKTQNYISLYIARCQNIMPPKFVKGENVMIENFDHDIKNMYIKPYNLGEEYKRKTDQWTLMVPNFTKFGEHDKFTFDNTYGFQIDTTGQTIGLWTSQVNNEKGIYTISIDAGNGQIIISDSGKRFIELNTDDDRISIQNEAQTLIEMVEGVINMKGKTLNIDIENDINVSSTDLNRKHDNIKTEADKDEEKVDQLKIKGNKWEANYSTTKFESKSFENSTKKWVTKSPISGFSGVMTASSLATGVPAGSMPSPSAPNMSKTGVAKFGSPSTTSLPLLVAQPTIALLQQICAKVDAIGGHVSAPPTLVGVLSATKKIMQSRCVMG